MNDITFSEPCVVFALRREAMYFRKEFAPEQRVPGAPCWAAFCGPEWLQVVVLETGLGAAAMETALQWLLAEPLFIPLLARRSATEAQAAFRFAHRGIAELQKVDLYTRYPFGFFLKARFRLYEGELAGALMLLRKSAEYYDPAAGDILAHAKS